MKLITAHLNLLLSPVIQIKPPLSKFSFLNNYVTLKNQSFIGTAEKQVLVDEKTLKDK